MAAAHDATVSVVGPNGKRDIPFTDFPVAFMTTALELNELLTTVRFARWPAGHGHGFVEFARRHGDFAIASAAALLEEDASGRIKRASLTLGGVGVLPVRMREVEKALVGQTASEDLFRELCEECRKVDAIEDVHAPASYRQHLAAVLSRRALVAAHGRVGRA
jgi:aerobic carbon-monoxide dehydrogenase medium subunit